MVVRMEKLYPSASYSLGHEAWMLWWPLMVARILTIFQSKVFVMSLSLSQAQSLSSVPTRHSGSSLLMTASRITTLLQSSHQPFPPLPGNTAEFISTGVNTRPTFFGCFPTQNPPEYPMVIYLPNSPPFYGANPVTK